MTVIHPLLARLGLRYPIIQAPMAGVSTPALAAAVSNAGGLGSLGLGASTVEQARQSIVATRAETDAPFNVNLFCHQPPLRNAQREADWLAHLSPLFTEMGAEPPAQLDTLYPSFLQDDAMLEMLLAERPAVVSFHFGIPDGDRLSALRQAGIHTLATATSVEEAEQIEAAGVGGIVAQGIEAGGHRGIFDPEGPDKALPTVDLVRILVSRTSLPVIAAGGIMDGHDIRTMLAHGAAAAQLGTAFILCPESAANAGYRARLQSEYAGETRMTAVLSGRPARGIANRFMTHCDSDPAVVPPAYPIAYDAAKRLHALATRRDNHEFAAHWAGTGAPRARKMTAAQLMAALIEELGLA
ncbi:nitronate monooxygenase [Ferrimonas balearica]|uniref:NAD(P)H-dependent flavin oxidoreductase n=1 Tax=Ferrimonas balearica TaxID=44012 RepID=UPI0028F701B9|nr:nitronate monooxygenase [Ferrimonas balearica]